jgi:hypothetical protein
MLFYEAHFENGDVLIDSGTSVDDVSQYMEQTQTGRGRLLKVVPAAWKSLPMNNNRIIPAYCA